VADYLLADGITPAAASRALAELLEVRDGRLCVSDRAYYDTFDGLLHAAGLMAVWEDGQLALIERASDRVRARAQLRKPARPFLAGDLEAGPLSDALQAVVEVRALLPVIEIHCRERPLDVLDGERKTVVRLRVQQPAVGRHRLRGRVHVAPVRGYDKALARVTEALGRELGFVAADRPLVDDAITAAGGRPGGTPAKIELALARRQRADAAAAAVLKALLGVIQANLDGAIADIDIEFLHDLRVSVRRSRAVQRELRGVFPAQELAHFRTEFRWLQQVTGGVRDLDVYVLEFDELRALVPEQVRPDLDPLLALLRKRRSAARRRMLRALRSERTSSVMAGWGDFVDRLETLPVEERPYAPRPVGTVAGERIAKVYRRMVKMGEAIDELSPPDEYHELRKQGKELRYLLELFGAPLYPDQVVRPMIRTLKGLQDVLGRHQDREIQVAMLRLIGPELSAAADGPAALMAVGVLVQRLEADQRAARDAFARRFGAFASRRQRKQMGDTFP
jgi:CHAD domain-containing protein